MLSAPMAIPVTIAGRSWTIPRCLRGGDGHAATGRDPNLSIWVIAFGLG